MKNFYIYLTFFVILVFILNSEHISQQLSYSNIFVPASENLVTNLEYNFPPKSFTKAYPIWGYSIVMIPGSIIGIPDFWIVSIQFALCIIGLILLVECFDLKKSFITLLLLLPYIALMSVKWPDAIVLFLYTLLFYHYKKYNTSNNAKYLLLMALELGFAMNFRGELLLLLPIIILSDFMINRSYKILYLLLSTSFITPWIIRNYTATDNFIVTSTNSGAVSYISLGQLPDNDWEIEPYDPTAYKIAKDKGFSSPYSFEANRYFQELYLYAIKEKPFEFIKKFTYNIFHISWGGVYTGEYANIFLEQNRYEIDKVVNDAKGLEKFEALFVIGWDVFLLIMSEKMIMFIFRIVFVLMILKFFLRLSKKPFLANPITILCISVIIHKILIVGFIQYEPRHINLIYPFLLAVTFSKKV